MNIILGAGLSGLIAGALNAGARIYERNPKSFTEHRAVLRFRTDKIGRALGMDFRRVTVRKAIWFEDREVAPTPRLANWYSRKVRGTVVDNSLWNIESAERFIAPDDLHARLAEICGERVLWGVECNPVDLQNWIRMGKGVASTLPLPALLKLLNVPSELEFKHAPIHVCRYNVPDCDVFQTVYFPQPETSVYRATLTGALLTIESSGQLEHGELDDVMQAFGLEQTAINVELFNHKQSYGKISPVHDAARKALLHRLTQEFGVYTLGRFATWRNILLDDVYEDIFHIRKMQQLSAYEHSLERMK